MNDQELFIRTFVDSLATNPSVRSIIDEGDLLIDERDILSIISNLSADRYTDYMTATGSYTVTNSYNYYAFEKYFQKEKREREIFVDIYSI